MTQEQEAKILKAIEDNKSDGCFPAFVIFLLMNILINVLSK